MESELLFCTGTNLLFEQLQHIKCMMKTNEAPWWSAQSGNRREQRRKEKRLSTFTSLFLLGTILPPWAWQQLTVARRPETLLPSVGATK